MLQKTSYGAAQGTLELRVCGTLIKTASIRDEEWIGPGLFNDPHQLVQRFLHERTADLFSFAQPLPNSSPSYSFYFEWDNAASVQLTNFEDWWKSLPQESRKNVRRSERRGVTVRTAQLDTHLVKGIHEIYNETPIRQGRRFRHYGKAIEQVARENSSYLDRSEFLAAYHNYELIGFLKFVLVNDVARIMQIVSKEAHADKRPTNALIAAAVRRACDLNASHFVYGRYVYGTKRNSPMTEFKRRNGFQELLFPRYYVPLTLLGKVALSCRLHRDFENYIPERLLALLLNLRASVYARRSRACLRNGFSQFETAASVKKSKNVISSFS